MVTNADEPLEVVVGKLLLERNQTMATAESCSGGYIAHLITSIPGSSAYYEGSLVTHSYKSQRNPAGGG
ncbi:MAG: CinA family protein [Ferruginibacter sp.]